RDEAVFGFARVELAARAVGFELGPFEREPLTGEPGVVLLMQLADRAGGRSDAGGGHGVQEGGGDGLVEAAAAKRLAGLLGCVELVAAHAGIAADLAVGSGIAD